MLTHQQVYLYDFSVDKWTPMPPMQTGGMAHGCGLIHKPDGRLEAVVAGGDHENKSVEILNLETMSWR